MEGSFKKHIKKSMDLLEFRKCIVCHHLDTHVYHADPGRTGRPQKRNIDSHYEGLNHVTNRESKHGVLNFIRTPHFDVKIVILPYMSNVLLDITLNSRYLPSEVNIILYDMYNVRRRFT